MTLKTALVLSLLGLAATPALAEIEDVCAILKIEEVNAITTMTANKTRANTTRNGQECSFLDARQNAILTVEIRPAKLPKAELDLEAENLQKIYRTSVKAIEVGDGGFWLNSKYELYFRKGKNIVRLVMVPAADSKITQARSETAARLVESRIK